MPQKHEKPHERNVSEEEVQDIGQKAVDAAATEHKEAIDDDVDAILDEIDDVLETNAEDFVKSFIQKGGQ
jgi:ubiquitin-like protein Pup